MISYFDPEKAKDCDWISAKAWVRMVDRAIRMAGRNKGNLLKGIVNCLVPSMSFYPDFILILSRFYLDFI